MNWYRKAQKESYLGSNWPKFKVDEENISKYIREQNQLPSRWIPVDSSFIKEVAYHDRLRVLDIRLRNGKAYTFSGVPNKVFQNFMKSKSKGEYFNRVIKKKYAY